MQTRACVQQEILRIYLYPNWIAVICCVSVSKLGMTGTQLDHASVIGHAESATGFNCRVWRGEVAKLHLPIALCPALLAAQRPALASSPSPGLAAALQQRQGLVCLEQPCWRHPSGQPLQGHQSGRPLHASWHWPSQSHQRSGAWRVPCLTCMHVTEQSGNWSPFRQDEVVRDCVLAAWA